MAVVCLNKIDSPCSECFCIVVEVAIAPGPLELAGERADARVQPDLKPYGMHVVGEFLHAQGEALGVWLLEELNVERKMWAERPFTCNCPLLSLVVALQQSSMLTY